MWQGGHAGPVRQALFTPKGDRVVSCGDDKTVQLWNAADGKPVKSIAAHDGAVLGVGVSADGTKIASIGADKALKVWTLAAAPGGQGRGQAAGDRAGRRRLGRGRQPPTASAWRSPSPTRPSTLLRVFDAASGKELLSLSDHTAAVKSLAFLADNRTLVSASADKTVRLSDVNVLSVIDAHAGGVAGCAFSPTACRPFPAAPTRRSSSGT